MVGAHRVVLIFCMDCEEYCVNTLCIWGLCIHERPLVWRARQTHFRKGCQTNQNGLMGSANGLGNFRNRKTCAAFILCKNVLCISSIFQSHICNPKNESTKLASYHQFSQAFLRSEMVPFTIQYAYRLLTRENVLSAENSALWTVLRTNSMGILCAVRLCQFRKQNHSILLA